VLLDPKDDDGNEADDVKIELSLSKAATGVAMIWLARVATVKILAAVFLKSAVKAFLLGEVFVAVVVVVVTFLGVNGAYASDTTARIAKRRAVYFIFDCYYRDRCRVLLLSCLDLSCLVLVNT